MRNARAGCGGFVVSAFSGGRAWPEWCGRGRCVGRTDQLDTAERGEDFLVAEEGKWVEIAANRSGEKGRI
jgi:hypothetical protein